MTKNKVYALPSKNVGSLEIAEIISGIIGSYVHADFFQFVSFDEGVVKLWYHNDSGRGPTFEIDLAVNADGTRVEIIEHPPGVEPPRDYDF